MAQFGSRIGMILATAGSAVGLGNIWRFPTTVGENGGAALILVYIFFTLILGIPGMLAEFIVGRNGKANACQSYKKSVCKLPSYGHKMGYGIGLLGMLSASLILGFYSVVAGWCIYYFAQAIFDNVLGSPEHISQGFSVLTENPWIPSILAVIFILLTHLIIRRGVRGGIERASKIMMPLLFIMLIALIIASCTLPGAYNGIVFLFRSGALRSPRTVILLPVTRYGMSLHLCLIFSGRRGHTQIIGTDSRYRLYYRHHGWTDDIPCGILCRYNA